MLTNFENIQVSVIQSCSQGIHKLVESLQQKFPAYSKSQLRNKVREMSDFVDNHWQVRDLFPKVLLTYLYNGSVNPYMVVVLRQILVKQLG